MTNAVDIKIRGKNRGLDQTLRESQQMIENFGTAVKLTMVGIAGVFAVDRIFSFGKELFSLYTEQERQEAKIASVIRATGGAAGFSAEQMGKLASAIQEVTTFGDEVVLETQAILATFKNIRGDNFKDATMAAADMAVVLGTDLKSGAVQLGKALNDPIKGVAALSRVGVTFTQDQKDMIEQLIRSNDVMGAQRVILDELSSEFGGAARDEAQTFTGRLEQMTNTIGDLKEQIMMALVPAFEAVLPWFEMGINFVKNMTDALNDQSSTIGGVVEMLSGHLTAAFKTAVEIAVGSFTAMQVAANNWQKSLELGVAGVALAFVSHFENLKWWYTEQLPALLMWFARNWESIFIDLANFVGTVVTNMGKNIGDFIVSVMNLLQGNPADFKFTSLTEGFEATLDELPPLVERKLSPTEKKLRKRMQELAGGMAGEFNEKFAKNMEAFNSLFEDKGDRATPDDISADLPISDDFAIDPPKDKAKKEIKKARRKARKKAEREEEESSGAGAFVGLEDLAKNIQSAAASRSQKSLEEKIVDSVKSIPKQMADTVVTVADKVADGSMIVAKKMDQFFNLLKEQNDAAMKESKTTRDQAKEQSEKLLKKKFVTGVK